MLHALTLLLPLLATPAQDADPREHYDVTAYELEWAVVPADQRLEGRVVVRATATAPELSRVTLDMAAELELVAATTEDGKALEAERDGDLLHVSLPGAVEAGSELAVVVQYRGNPKAKDDFSGFHWAETEGGQPWINTSCQGLGAHSWWPCKASYFHPSDKPARITASVTVPEGLVGVSNGRFVEEAAGAPAWFEAEGEWTTWRYAHPYPLETYSVTLNVAPYVVVEDTLETAAGEVPWIYYVLPENAEKAEVQFAQMPGLIAAFETAFGPWPFPESKIALVETNFWGMEHSTAVAYGSSYPLWCQQNDVPDPYARRNRDFDYILVHEVAHEWWGNAVSADGWGHFWIHEGLGTYAEGAYLELTESRERADEYFAGQNRRASAAKGALFRGEDVDSGQAYASLIYSKGACVLNTLRHALENDELWWNFLREFQSRYRYGNATTEDFFNLLEELHPFGRGYEWFARQYVYGEGSPRLKVDVEVREQVLKVRVDNTVGEFDCPVDIAWTEGDAERTDRLWIPGGKQGGTDYVLKAPATDVRVPHLDRLIGRHEVTIRGVGVPESD